MEDDLTWLALNVHEWPAGDTFIGRILKDGEFAVASVAGIPTSFVNWFTIDQWIERRSKMQNKPSWDDAPGWANWLCQRDDGMWFWCVEEPRASEDGWETRHEARAAYPSGDQIPEYVLGDWRDTLERRPRDLSEPAVTARLTEATENVLAAAPALMDEKFSIDRNDWFGRGDLPPVGVECAAVADGIPDANCVIVAISTDQVVVKWTENQMFDVLDMPGWSFSPIRTERDKAIDEMKQHCPYHGSWDTVGRIYAEALYDAGYRKQISPAK
ncbi:hypothetical protein [Aeromonas jandaei]|uniref:hypothetical protein n=1 Tax=Aeromonas jandaei TaxID=650 RepID=UPI002B058200|nr:hypothetical protein [Aeromonas jandaei]